MTVSQAKVNPTYQQWVTKIQLEKLRQESKIEMQTIDKEDKLIFCVTNTNRS